MPLDPDELAGVCDLFGGLTRDELAAAIADLAARRGDDYDRETHDAAVADAREVYVLVEVDTDTLDGVAADAPLLVVGPRAFPTLPEGGDDLPHLSDAPRRDVPSDAVETAIRARLAADVAALGDGETNDRGPVADAPDADVLIDVTYDAAALTGTDFADVRERITDAR